MEICQTTKMATIFWHIINPSVNLIKLTVKLMKKSVNNISLVAVIFNEICQ